MAKRKKTKGVAKKLTSKWKTTQTITTRRFRTLGGLDPLGKNITYTMIAAGVALGAFTVWLK